LPVILLIICLNFSTYARSDEIIAAHKQIELTQKERAFLDGIGIVQVLVDDNFAPISYYDSKSKEFGGIAIDVLEILSRTLQFKYEIIRDPNLDWAEKLNKIKKNQTHILGGASKNDTRLEYGFFTDIEYFTVNYALIGSINKHINIVDISDINQYRVGLIKGVTINDYIIKNLAKKNNITYFKTKKALFSALHRNEIDLAPNNEAVFKEEFFQGKLFDFEIVFSMNEIKKKYSFFCPKTDEGKYLTELLNKGMKGINIKKLIKNRYSNKSIFAFYKEHTDNLQYNINIRNTLLIFSGFFLITVIVIMLFFKKQTKHKANLVLKLENALSEVKQLQGIIPICSGCKQIRDSEGAWNQLEAYIHEHSGASFSHGMCPECSDKLYGDEDWYIEMKKNSKNKE
jgi:ABC-type amino acid transport substrate-binding protein